MKKLHSFALYALLAPAITLSSAAVLAQQSTGQDLDEEQQSSQHQPGSAQTAAERRNAASTTTQSRTEHRGYMDSTPANGLHASNLIGADVQTASDEDVGSVSDLVINESGQIVAIVVGVGGFLGMGEKDVAIGWDDVTKTVMSDEHELRINMTREALMSAPEFDLDD